MIDMFTAHTQDENRDRFITTLSDVGRIGTNELIKYLETKTDFFTAPASSIHHSNCDGGLVLHSLNVMDLALKINEALEFGIPRESIIISCLCHDICKAQYYVKAEKFRKNEHDRWETYMSWKVEEKLPLGHGEKSLILTNRFITLNAAEMCAIRWHMGAYDPGTAFNYPSGNPFHQSMRDYPLCTLIQMADLAAANVKETVYEL